jgi:hypothetical protein
MPIASEIELVGPGLWIWRVYDPAVKADLFSTAIATTAGLYLVDPIPLVSDALASLMKFGAPAGIVVTNENHERAADRFVAQLQVPLYQRSFIAPGLTAIPIDGGPPGEVAVYCEASGGTLVIGDALINCEPYGFALLPAKYCSNPKLMQRSLPKLLDYPFTRLLFAHGTPIVSRARQRLEELLQGH